MMGRCILRQDINASQQEFVWSPGHSNICAPRLVYQSWAVFVTVTLAIQYVFSLSPEKQFSDVETGQKRPPHPVTKIFISFKIFPILPV